jgi:hypothetical protein
VSLIRLIKAWAHAEGRRDEEIFALLPSPDLAWPWLDKAQLGARLAETAAAAEGCPQR